MTPLLTPLLIPFPNIDPVLFSFTLFGLNLSIHWYAVAYNLRVYHRLALAFIPDSQAPPLV